MKDKIKARFFKENNDYFVYTKIPSESNSEYPNSKPIYYDVIFQLSPPNKAAMDLNSIREYDLKVFSNMPSFIYTFNYVYHYKRALITLPNGYYAQKAITDKAKVRNPLKLLGIDKSLWFTVYYLDEKRAFRRDNFEALCDQNLTLLGLLKDERIMTQDRKMYECELRQNHKRNLKEAENNKKIRENRINGVKKYRRDVRSQEVLELFDNLAPNLRAQNLKTDSLNSGLHNSTHHQVKTNNLKSSLKR
jgi:hypothetical protein